MKIKPILTLIITTCGNRTCENALHWLTKDYTKDYLKYIKVIVSDDNYGNHEIHEERLLKCLLKDNYLHIESKYHNAMGNRFNGLMGCDTKYVTFIDDDDSILGDENFYASLKILSESDKNVYSTNLLRFFQDTCKYKYYDKMNDDFNVMHSHVYKTEFLKKYIFVPDYSGRNEEDYTWSLIKHSEEFEKDNTMEKLPMYYLYFSHKNSLQDLSNNMSIQELKNEDFSTKL